MRPRRPAGDLEQQLVVGELPERLVEAHVELADGLRRAALGGRRHPAREAGELGVRRGRPALEHARADELLEHDAHARDLLEQPRRELGDARAAPRQAHHEPLLGKPRERLAHGDVARPELARDGALDEPRARRVGAVADQVAQLVGDAACDADRGVLGGGGSHSAGSKRYSSVRVKRQAAA